MASGKRRKDLLQALQRGGVPLDSEIVDKINSHELGLSIVQTGTILENTVMTLDKDHTGFMLSIVVYNDSDRVICVDEFRFELPWAEPNFHWLKPIRSHTYSFPDNGPQGFPRDVVLNHLASGKGRINPGGYLDGLLLGLGDARLPDEYRHRQLVTLPLNVFDTRGRTCRSTINVQIDRKSGMPAADRAFTSHGKPSKYSKRLVK